MAALNSELSFVEALCLERDLLLRVGGLCRELLDSVRLFTGEGVDCEGVEGVCWEDGEVTDLESLSFIPDDRELLSDDVL